MTKSFRIIALVAILPFALAACGKATNSNTNVAVLDLVNDSANVNTVPTVNVNAGSNANVTVNQNTNSASTPTIVNVTNTGFSPASVTVKVGATVEWTNVSGSEIFIASDPHPTHTDLPGLSSGTVANGATYSFTFTKVGTWGYHNHLDPTTKGTIIVQL
jgi:plastocyanin